MHYFFYTFSCYPLINPRVNPADILPVRGIPKLVIANEDAAVWLLSILVPLNYGIFVIRFVSVVSAPSDTV
jgi:hypothetical protein